MIRRASISPRRALVALLLPLPGLCGGTDVRAQTQWQVDSASIRFEIRNAGLPVRGSFSGLHAEAGFDPTMPGRGAVVASIDAATIETGIGLRDRHLRRPGYFDVERYPRMRLESVRLTSADKPGRYTGIFILEIKGTRREVSFPFTFTTAGPAGRFAATFTIDRRDFGIGESSIILADDVTIYVDVMVRSVSRAAPPHNSPRSIRSTA